MRCSRGDAKNQAFNAVVTFPSSVSEGSTVTVRIDSVPSSKLSHFGLNYIWDMTTEYVIPDGATYVPGSAHIVADTGTANVRTGASVAQFGRRLRVVLPAHVANGSTYTPPSVEFALRIDAHGGTPLALAFAHYEVSANVFLLGNLTTTCEPNPNPYPIGMTLVDPHGAVQ